MNRLLVLIVVFYAVTACHVFRSGNEDVHVHASEDERPALSFTHWTDHSELFIELPALVRDVESPCAAHVTKLDSFTALAQGQVSVVLQKNDVAEHFDSTAPSVPGIFRPVVKPTSAGVHRLIVRISGEQLTAEHDLGEVVVHDNIQAARAAAAKNPDTAPGIAFLKEQQWPIDFATSVVGERSIRPTISAWGVTQVRSDRDLFVTAPVAGRIAASKNTFPRLGDRVNLDDLLAVVAPKLEAADLASLELSVTNTDLEVRFAQRERERLEALRTEGAVPQRRVQEAVHAVEEAQVAHSAAKRRLAQFRRVERTSGLGGDIVRLRAPFSGTVTAVSTAPGAFVDSGTPLFRISDLEQLWLEVHIPAADIGRLGTPSGVSFQIDGTHERVDLPPQALIARGHIVDPKTQTLPLVFALENPQSRVPVGAFCRVFVATGEERRALAIPESALVDDSGSDVVFVQTKGEAFERRVVRLGIRDRGFVEVLSGVQAGEHLVIRGAWSIKLAASSGSLPQHGHAH